jgi:ABC-type sugar transport system substrate-binding protein
MVRAGVWPAPTAPSAEQREQEVREALAKYRAQAFVDGHIEAHTKANAWRQDASLEAIGRALARERQRMRAE